MICMCGGGVSDMCGGSRPKQMKNRHYTTDRVITLWLCCLSTVLAMPLVVEQTTIVVITILPALYLPSANVQLVV